jgi:hypothetical protein
MLNKVGLSAIAMSVIIITTSAHAAPAKRYYPKDECLHLDGYFEFRQQFEDIVKKRNTAGLQTLIAPNIEWNFGGEPATKAAFAKNWALTKGAGSPIWAELDKILPLGCGVSGDGIAFPHIFTVDLSEDKGLKGDVLVIHQDVNLRATPSSSAASKAKISWEMLSITEDKVPDDGWSPVTAADGKTGFIKSNYLRNILDYRAGFQKREGKWVMNFFTAGD